MHTEFVTQNISSTARCRWGHTLAEHPVGKGHGFRSLIHTAKVGTVVHDASYWIPWELQGSMRQLQDAMTAMRQARWLVESAFIAQSNASIAWAQRQRYRTPSDVYQAHKSGGGLLRRSFGMIWPPCQHVCTALTSQQAASAGAMT